MAAVSIPAPPKDAAEIYVNLFIRNKKGIVKQQVSDQLMPKNALERSFARLAGKIADGFCTTDEVTRLVAEGVVEEMPMELKKLGIRVLVQVKFRRENFLVLAVRVVGVDLDRMAAVGEMPPWLASGLSCCSCIAPVRWGVHKGVSMALVKQLPTKMADDLIMKAGVEADVVTQTAQTEANYLFAVLADMERRQGSSSRSRPTRGSPGAPIQSSDKGNFAFVNGPASEAIAASAAAAVSPPYGGRSPHSHSHW
mmetsp:Transcript_87331/g.182777  ORF Transcript_87331/g.182777 Transcript_87331/m.182777 type:complete len:253 (+) Transcript_87331:365-1123(+)